MPNNSNPTIYDVAKASGVSITTVSRVLNNPDLVGEKSRRKVLSAIEELGFVPAAEASARARKVLGRVGVLTPFFTAPSFVRRMHGVAVSLSEVNYELIVYTVDSRKRLDSYLDTLPIAKNLDGLIIMSLPFEEQFVNRSRRVGLETVVIEYKQNHFSSVDVDNSEGGRVAARYLLEQGYRKPAFVGEKDLPDYLIWSSAQRLAGFREMLDDAGVELPPGRVQLHPYNNNVPAEQLERLLRSPSSPDAIFVSSDLQAIQVLKTIRSLGMGVPDDVAVLGFDNIEAAEFMDLSTVDQFLVESGKIAVELLLSRLTKEENIVRHVNLQLSVRQRDTA